MRRYVLGILLIGLISCGEEKATQAPEVVEGPLFTRLDSSQTKVKFINQLNENDRVNYFSYEYLYNGGGVAAGDINNDGLTDLYFTGNFVPNRLYLNKGNFEFEDITAKAKVATIKDWATGVTMVDINHDGWLDIYVNRSGTFRNDERRSNLLFLNNKDLTFTEVAQDLGISDKGYSTQSTFFDYDRDGDLDLYVANHPHEFTYDMDEFMRRIEEPPAANKDRLYRNDVTWDGNEFTGKFTDVSEEAGIKNYAHSLGLLASDLDQDGWVDLYVSNDYHEADYLYHNNGDGTFTNQVFDAMGHMAKFSMGVDGNDMNNDGWVDIFAVEMMAEDNRRQKTNMASMNPDLFWQTVDYGFGYQYMHNVLQLNNGNSTYSEIAYLSGIATTDWSWAPLFADFDRDGYKDLFITNGYKRDVLDKDFNSKLKYYLKVKGPNDNAFRDLVNQIPSTKIQNYIYRNNGDLTFEKKSDSWGLTEKTHSNGAVYADLDNDGDLDLVVNNIDEPALIYQNNATDGNYLKIKFSGTDQNLFGLGARVYLWANGEIQYNELTLTRGFQSSLEPYLYFGLGAVETIDSLLVVWPDQQIQKMNQVAANQMLTLDHAQSSGKYSPTQETEQLFTQEEFKHKHEEKNFDDYGKQVLLPHKLSQLGPSIAVADVNADGLDDYLIGGASGQETTLYVQTGNGEFRKHPVPDFRKHAEMEDQGALFLDVDGDKDIDLIILSGSYEFDEESGQTLDRLYINDGSGNFTYNPSALPDLKVNSSSISAADIDNDQDLDLFIGGRLISGKYPYAPSSYILINEDGKFTDGTPKIAPDISSIGMVTSSLWTDYDNDSDPDLILAGEWMPVTVFENDQGSLVDKTAELGLDKTHGWWNSISGGDIDNDGDIDLVLGNLGTNSKNKATEEFPFDVFAGDYDSNNSVDIVLGYYNDGEQYPVRGLQCSSEQIPVLKEQIGSYQKFGSLNLEGIYTEWLDTALHLSAYTFESSWFENRGEEGFVQHALPNHAQIAPSYGSIIGDMDQDGCQDILLVGNQYPVEVETGRYDAHKGIFLKGNCTGEFEPVASSQSGLLVEGDAKAMALIGMGAEKEAGILISTNDGPVLLYRIKGAQLSDLSSSGKNEYHYGSGYLSQNSKGAP